MMPNVDLKYGMIWYGEYVKPKHIELARKWLEKQSWKEYKYLKFPPGWAAKALGPVRCKIENKPDGPVCATFQANWGTNEEKYKQAEERDIPYFPKYGSSTTITFSKWLTTIAMVRQLYMHEVIEVYNLIGFQQFDKPISVFEPIQKEADEMAEEYTKMYFFDSERQIGENNLKCCEDDLSRIIPWLIKHGSISPLPAGITAAYLEVLKRTIHNQKYIPGYCEAYVPFGYEKPELSSIAWIINAAKLARIKLNR